MRRALDEQFNLPAQRGRGLLLTAIVQIPHRQFIEVDALVKKMVTSAAEEEAGAARTTLEKYNDRCRSSGHLPSGQGTRANSSWQKSSRILGLLFQC